MARVTKLSAEDKEWRARCDADAIIRANMIATDRERKALASKELKRRAQELEKEANLAKKASASTQKTASKPATKPTNKKKK